MIESLTVSGFRAARHVELSNMAPINLFIGPNGSGKTSLLQAAFLFCIEADARLLLPLAPPETAETNAEAIHRALSWIFTVGEPAARKSIDVSGIVDGRPRSVSVKPVEVTPGLTKEAVGDLERSAPGNSIPEGVARDLNAIRDSANLVLELATTDNGETHPGRLFVSHAHGVFGESPRRTAPLPASLTRAERAQQSGLAKLADDAQAAGTMSRITDLLRAIDPDVKQLMIGVAPNGSPVVRVEHARLGLCPLNVLGDGFGAALHFALWLSIRKIKFVMFDEFDASLHVSVLKQLAKFAEAVANDGIQLFLTTHRADTVGAFVDLVEEGWDGLRVFQTRLEDGEIRVQGFGGDRLVSVWRELALDIRVPS